jgi:hypothetical protein
MTQETRMKKTRFTKEQIISRECLALEVDTSLPSARVIGVLERAAADRG